MSDAHKTFETTDLAVACFLYAKDIPLIDILPTSTPKKSTFVFRESKDIPRLVQAFWSGEENISPLKLFAAEREIKKRLYSDTSQSIHVQKGDKQHA